MHNADSSSFQRQVIDALKTILRALGLTGGRVSSNSSTSSAPSSSSDRSLVTALNGISTRLDGINGDLKDIIIGEEPETSSDDNNG